MYIGCAVLQLTNGDVTYTNDQAIGSTATHTCNSGYSLSPVGGETRTCTTSGWDGQSITCGKFPGLMVFLKSLMHYIISLIFHTIHTI